MAVGRTTTRDVVVISYGRQLLDEDDIAAVVAVLRGDWLTQGPAVEKFEQSLAHAVEAPYAVVFSSATAGLHAALAVAEIGAGDVVATSSLSFVASANCARYLGATPAFVDVDPGTLNLRPDKVPADVAALVAVHYAGLPVDLSALHGRPPVIVEDAAHALGAITPDGPVGNCARSDMCVFSFHPVKAITTGEGGAVTTRSRALADALRRFRSHGIVRVPEKGGWYYQVAGLGYNYRLTDVQSALGQSQLSKLEGFLARRAELAQRYDALLADLPVTLPPVAPSGTRHAHHLYAVRIRDRRRVYDGLRERGIVPQVHYVPIHHHPAFAGLGFTVEHLPETERAYEQLLSLPLHPGLTNEDQDLVVDILKRLL